MSRFLYSLFLISISNFIFGQLQSPEEFLGYNLGDLFSRHHQVVDYFKHLEQNSSQIQLVPYGKTNEGRLLQLAFISSEKNIEQLEAIRTRHLHNSGSIPGPKNNDKAIVWLSYNVHGNESSSSEAAMKTAHALLTKYQDWLQDTVIILDPCINPDGRDRYVNFYKQHRSFPYDDNRHTIEHNESWHNGRTNHYVFDLNRDWAWLTQVESQQRLKQYNQWLPHIHVDFHEQGINSPYYFAPAAEPLHEVITDFQKEFQDALGKNHARYFDKEGWFYFTKQHFDILYPSYGDSYPMYLGAIGMTYEQAGGGVAGLGVQNDETIELTLKDRIEHHYTTGISTVEMAVKNRVKLNKNYQEYFSDKDLKYKNFILEGNQDQMNALAQFFKKHNIESARLAKNSSVRGFDYQSQKNGSTSFTKNALVISTDQTKGKMAHILLEPNTKLNDSLTYDITAWSLPYAYGLKANATQENVAVIPYSEDQFSAAVLDKNQYGHALNYRSFEDSKFLAALLKEGLGVRYNSVPLTNSGKPWKEGSLFVLKGDNTKKINYTETLQLLANQFKRKLYPIQTGYSELGPDLGADELHLIKAPKVAVLRTDATSSYRYGEIWHFFEQQLEYPLIQVELERLERILPTIDLLILPGGSYDKWSNNPLENKIEEWISQGGKIVALSEALDIFADTENFSLKKKEAPENDTTSIPYAELERNKISEITTGSIYKASMDQSHTLSFGVDQYYTLKLNADAYELLEDRGNAYTLNKNVKPLSGFIGHLAKNNQKNSLLFGQEYYGNGSLIYFVDNLLFRGFWYNGKQVFSNALFF